MSKIPMPIRASTTPSAMARSKSCSLRTDRQRVGNSEHAEYYTDEGKVILSGGEPKLERHEDGVIPEETN